MSLVAAARLQPCFDTALRGAGLEPLRRARITTLQLNLGKRCNQACHHCHVDASPRRTEMMAEDTARAVANLMASSPTLDTVDFTGGAPELNPWFRWLVDRARALELTVMVRHNLTVLFEPGQEDLADFFTSRDVELICSLPCYSRENVDRQRGKGVFGRSVQALQALNQRGYGAERILDLVYNPGGAFLPPPQAALEAEYRERLREDFGVVFSRLFTLTNMPIARFADALERQGRYSEYLDLMVQSFNPATVSGLMCRSLLSVDWRGRVFDCDFNQMLELPLGADGVRTLADLDSTEALHGAPVAVRSHCFGCTAGAGSSCGGALA